MGHALCRYYRVGVDRAGDALSAYLRARRTMVLPEDVGLPAGGRRRVPGLRREEVALLAGISPDYYVRLEQGRGHRPSREVLNAIAAALGLDGPATSHLHRLATAAPVRGPRRTEQVPTGIRHLLRSLEATLPAFVQNRFMDVLASNRLAVAVSPSFAVGSNVVRAAFLDPAMHELYEDWELVARETVAGLRASVGARVDDPRLTALVDDLSEHSDEFRRLWARHDVLPKTGGVRRLRHPLMGAVVLRHEKLALTGVTGQLLVVHHAEPDTPSAAAFAELARTALDGAAPR
jgi:transcriptional regulator with XRE-family HTH domain